MHAHNNVLQVKLELLTIAVVLPVCGIIASFVLWQRARRTEASDEYVVLGLRSIAFSFATFLVWLALTSLSSRDHWSASPLIFVLLPILLPMIGAIAACSGFILMFLRARGSLRYTGASLAGLALAYAVIAGLALLAGGGGPG